MGIGSFQSCTPFESASSLDGTASLDLGSAENCKSRRTFSAELICMATKMGSLLPSSRLDGLALYTAATEVLSRHRPLVALHKAATLQAFRSHAGSSTPRAGLVQCWVGPALDVGVPDDGSE